MFALSILDLLFIAYLIWSFINGQKKGLGKELEGLIVALLFLGTLLGIFVISMLSGIIKTTLQAALLSSGFLISLSSFTLAVVVFFFFRKKIAEFSESTFSQRASHNGGAVIGFLRGTVIIGIFSIFLTSLPFGLFEEVRQTSEIYNQAELLLNLEKPEKPTTSDIPNEPEELIIGY